MVERNRKFTSKHFYAVDFDNVGLEVYSATEPGRFTVHTYTIPAVWFKTKKGLRTVSEGCLRFVVRAVVVEKYATVEEAFLAEFDGRYGGSSVFQWDGERMYAPNQSFEDMREAQVRLQTYLDGFPEPPTGYTGWFSIKE